MKRKDDRSGGHEKIDNGEVLEGYAGREGGTEGGRGGIEALSVNRGPSVWSLLSKHMYDCN